MSRDKKAAKAERELKDVMDALKKNRPKAPGGGAAVTAVGRAAAVAVVMSHRIFHLLTILLGPRSPSK